MSLLYTSKEFDQKTGNYIKFQVLGFFFVFRKPKTLILEDAKLVFILSRYLSLSICGLD